jgi:hypothetical protein
MNDSATALGKDILPEPTGNGSGPERGPEPQDVRAGCPSSLSDLELIYCGKADIGRNFRSISLNSYGYSPQLIENFDSIPLSLTRNGTPWAFLPAANRPYGLACATIA